VRPLEGATRCSAYGCVGLPARLPLAWKTVAPRPGSRHGPAQRPSIGPRTRRGLASVSQVQQAKYLRQANALADRCSQARILLLHLGHDGSPRGGRSDSNSCYCLLRTAKRTAKPAWCLFAGDNKLTLSAPGPRRRLWRPSRAAAAAPIALSAGSAEDRLLQAHLAACRKEHDADGQAVLRLHLLCATRRPGGATRRSGPAPAQRHTGDDLV